MSSRTDPLPDSPSPTLAAMFDAYQPLPGVFDEMKTADGELRPHWRNLVGALRALSPSEMDARWKRVERILYENGLTHNIFADGDETERPWRLDALPLLISAEDWRRLENGLVQRARLLDAVLSDCYGEQRLMLDGALPSTLVLGNPQFLRPLHGVPVSRGRRLHYYAADVGRSADGNWWVMKDRCESPVGGGYALENRIALRNCLPDEFVGNHVQQLAGFFQAVHDGHCAMADSADPRIVVLSTGPTGSGYFAHSYLARYQGYVLAEGQDLTVRDNRVYLKTLEGLRRVDIIIRRVEAASCDPLELRSDSPHGVPGLVEAVRAGTVSVINALGSGLADTESLMPFLPGLCERLLNEQLQLPSLATWWCGQDPARDYVLANLEHLETRDVFSRGASEPGTQNPDGPEAWQVGGPRRSIEERGFAYLAREPMRLSTVPVLNSQGLRPVPFALRVFVAADADGYVVMPGGLARLCPPRAGQAFDFGRFGDGKDTWVQSDRQAGSAAIRRTRTGAVELRRIGRELPSRTADNLFWLGSYAERAEAIMRQARNAIVRIVDDECPPEDLLAIGRVLGPTLKKAGIAPADNKAAGDTRSQLERRLGELVFDADRAYGLRRTLRNLGRTASLSRERLSADSWRILRGLRPEDFARRSGPAAQPRRAGIGSVLGQLDLGIQRLAAFSGMGVENMTRSFGWRFLDMGRRIERSVQTSALLESLLDAGDPEDDGSLILLLEIADSFMTYRSRYLLTPQLAPVLDLLLLDETNPRSVLFQLEALAEHLEALPRDPAQPVPDSEQRIVTGALDELRQADISSLCRRGRLGDRPGLKALVGRVAADLPVLITSITRKYFSHADAVRSVIAAHSAPR
ncbi:MAG: circularly permuted type 2 ATP-grasp protein [Steroidobacteraceae bacterium]|nr:circularly permuted type 2 ATP-grasp protein [Steroidobacteraceae bacterium]